LSPTLRDVQLALASAGPPIKPPTKQCFYRSDAESSFLQGQDTTATDELRPHAFGPKTVAAARRRASRLSADNLRASILVRAACREQGATSAVRILVRLHSRASRQPLDMDTSRDGKLSCTPVVSDIGWHPRTDMK
jgi:hypothetical protein